MEPQSFCTKTQFPLPQNCFLFVFFFFFNIYWFSSSSFREYSQMCKATSNSNISWSKKWNLHLIAFFNNVQSPFNRKMEQSANRKRKGLIKTQPSPSWQCPSTETRQGWAGGAGALQDPQSLTALPNPHTTGGEGPRQGCSCSWRSGVVATTIPQLAFLFAEENKAGASETQPWILLCSLTNAKGTRKSQKQRWALSRVQHGHSPSFSTQRQQNLGTAPVPKEWATSCRRSWLLQGCDLSDISSPGTAQVPFQARLSQSVQHKHLPSHPDLSWLRLIFVVVVVFIFIIYITDLLLMDSHLHMSEYERNHLITWFSHQLWNRVNNLLSTPFSSFFLYMWFTISCQLQAGRIIF